MRLFSDDFRVLHHASLDLELEAEVNQIVCCLKLFFARVGHVLDDGVALFHHGFAIHVACSEALFLALQPVDVLDGLVLNLVLIASLPVRLVVDLLLVVQSFDLLVLRVDFLLQFVRRLFYVSLLLADPLHLFTVFLDFDFARFSLLL